MFRFQYTQAEDGTISDLRKISLYQGTKWEKYGNCMMDTYVKDYSINDDKKGFTFRTEMPDYLM